MDVGHGAISPPVNGAALPPGGQATQEPPAPKARSRLDVSILYGLGNCQGGAVSPRSADGGCLCTRMSRLSAHADSPQLRSKLRPSIPPLSHPWAILIETVSRIPLEGSMSTRQKVWLTVALFIGV